ncbi:MAG TPA: C25 family cysteine peptidase [Candidatus Eisenbacteria bacterium]|nr:C25 family cysteine peptidase [Candidatus Eisenbacteria bacterium]
MKLRFAPVLVALFAILAGGMPAPAASAPAASTTAASAAAATSATADAKLGPSPVRTVAQDLRGATFEVIPDPARFETLNSDGTLYSRVTVRGALLMEAAGRPALPTITLHAAIPEGMSPRLRIVSEEWDDRMAPPPVPVTRQRFVGDDPRTGPISEFKVEPNPAIYRGAAVYPPAGASVGAGALVGSWWVAPIHVRPVRWNPSTGAYRVLRKMSLAVDFVPATDQDLRLRPVSRPRVQAAVWDRVQRGLVKNYQAARAFPQRPPVTPRRSALPARSRFAANPEFKLRVAQSGWTSVSYATLASAGFPSGIAINLVGIQERGYDDVGDSATATQIPVVARDANLNSVFDGGDAIAFFARNVRDRVGNGNVENRYTNENVYWLSWDVTPALTPGPIPGVVAGAVPGPTSFREVIRLEENHVAWTAPNPTGASPPEAVDYLFWADGEAPDQFGTTIPFAAPDPAQPFRIRSRHQGTTTTTHRLSIFFQGSSGVMDTLALADQFVDDDIYFLDTGFTIPGSHIGPGTNQYRHVGERRPPGLTDFQPGSKAMLDVVEVTYNRLYVAQNNALRFTSGSTTGLFDLAVTGFTSSAIEVYDVTVPTAPLRVLPVNVTPAGPTFTVQFQTDASGGERRFAAVVPGAENPLGAGAVVADQTSDLRTPGAFGASNEARSIVITPGAFLAQATRLANYRRGQGYVVEVADIEDVYDQFNGGVKSARAIRRYLRHAYLAWSPAPAYVVLAGDASMDHKHEIPASGVDWVPTYHAIETIIGSHGKEQVAHESYFSLNLSAPLAGEFDFVPSVSLARIPAGTAAELDQYIDKVIQYEDFQPTDSWRGRQLLFSDDEYSTTINFSGGYCFQSHETEFLVTSQRLADSTMASTGGIDVQTDFFNLKAYSDAVPPTFGCKNILNVWNIMAAPGGAYETLQSKINQGGLIFNLQTHANRYLAAHELVLCGGNSQFCFAPNTPDRLQNVNRPFLMMVWGCHANQFADGPTFRSIIDGGGVDSTDAIGELWLFAPARGSIATLGSSAYEYLQTNSVLNESVYHALYRRPRAPDPAPGQPRQARWIVGDVMLDAAVENALASLFEQQVMNRTMNLAGDPMLRMDALPPRVFEAMLDGVVVAENAPVTVDSPTDSVTLVARLRDEVAIASVRLVERDVATGALTPIDSTTYTVAFNDSSRLAELTGRVRPHVGNYDLQVRGTDINGRFQAFSFQVRTPIRYFANGIEIVSNVFVESGAMLRAEVTSPIPLTADSLELIFDGVPISATKTQTDLVGRRWALQSLGGDRSEGSHTIQVAIGGRTAGLDERTFQITSEFTLRGVAVVSQRVQGAGCGGQVFQYELSSGAEKVELLILSVAGRRIASLDLPRQAGFNVFCWDGRDSQGHEAATGVYFYRVKATDPGGRTLTRDGRMIRSR